MTRSITDTQHNNALHYAECHALFFVMLNVILLNVVMLSVIMLRVTALKCYGSEKFNRIGQSVNTLKTFFLRH
jgi:hypothetical protein